MREQLLFGVFRFGGLNQTRLVSALALGALLSLGGGQGAFAQEALASDRPVASPSQVAPVQSIEPAMEPAARPVFNAPAFPAPAVAQAAPRFGETALGVPALAASAPSAPSVETAPAAGVPASAVGSAQSPGGVDLAPVKHGPQHDLSPMGMFLAADPVVKGVMLLLAAASVATWTVLLGKTFGLMAAKRGMRQAIRALRRAATLSEAMAEVRKGTGAQLLREAVEEAQLSSGLPSEGVKERVHIALCRVEVAAGRRMAIGTGLLATIGSVGPFVGLFGTVWGIMRSFIGIANSNTTNLAVVAPGIAEALLATGIGLVAAIPAVVIYNAMTRSIGGYRALTGDAVALIMRHLSRDLDRHEFGSSRHHHAHARMAAE